MPGVHVLGDRHRRGGGAVAGAQQDDPGHHVVDVLGAGGDRAAEHVDEQQHQHARGSTIDMSRVSTSRRVSRMLRPISVAVSARYEPAARRAWAEAVVVAGTVVPTPPEGALLGRRAVAGEGEEDVVESRAVR